MDPSTAWKELVSDGEQARFEVFAAQLVELQKQRATDGRTGRALHRKGTGGFEARFEVADHLPDAARHGLFATPGTYDAYVRFSNGAGEVASDTVRDVRGIAVKVMGVPGKKVLGTATTQDFLAILSSSIPFQTADQFAALVWATRSKALALPRLIGAFGPLGAMRILRRLLAGRERPFASLAMQRFYSVLPIQCGPYAARFSFASISASAADRTNGAEFLSIDLANRLRAGEIVYQMSLQFFVDETRTPIEDPSVDWPEDVSPYVDVARLVVAQQDSSSARGQRVAEHVDALSFDPWHALEEHRPLGGMMRARKYAYFASTRQRGAAAEPDGPLP